MGRESATSSKSASNDGFGVSPPSLTLPKGGGAIRGIGEKFGANPVTGTGSMSVPIATSLGRSGFGPRLSLSYDSGAGNGPFGFGWGLSLPSITRKTDKGVPRYLDASESDVFVLSGAEDLVPVLEKQKQSDKWVRKSLPPRMRHGHTYTVALFRPRIEGLFARIERWTNTTNATDVFWRSITRDNIATLYGTTFYSRIADPRDLRHIFSWLICESYDDKGNAIFYEYARENGPPVPTEQAHERNRTRTANRYLKRVLYGNREPMYRMALPPADPRWMFETVFDYGEGYTAPIPVPEGEHERVQLTGSEPPADAWGLRQDAFSTFRAGFEVRTYRLCRRVLMLHRFPEELGVPRCLVRSTDFAYRETPIVSFITSVVQSGFRRDGETYIKRSMPPLEFEYSEATIDATVHDVPLDSVEHLPAGLGTSEYELLDLDAEGAPGILTRQTGGWFHKRNLSPSTFTWTPDGQVAAEAVFAPVEVLASQPAAGPEEQGRQFLDLAGDGQVDFVDFGGPVPGFYERTHEGGWEPFLPFTSLPDLDWSDPNLKFVDLTGDGHADVLVSEDDAFTWYASLGELGFGASERVAKALDEEDGPRLVFEDGTQSVYLADMSGDGLTDLVRIRNGEVCYWPSLGYARFGPKVTMDSAPWFDTSDLFSQSRVRLADIDGSGVTDIIYLASGGVRLYFNQSGNSWSAEKTLEAFPGTDNPSAVQAADLLGTGTACLVWSSPLPGDARQPMRYVDLMGGQKPHLLVRTVNNLGAETHVHYAPSTKFYLLDKRAGIPWITRPPFPVHVVEQVETTDRIGRSRFVTRYTYRHGFFDGVEREFRGFGLVEQRDTEEFTVLAGADALQAINIDLASHVPPVLTRTWFHTGVHVGRDRVSAVFSGIGKDTGEYYREPGSDDDNARTRLLEDTILPSGLSADEEREACRALKGSMLRQEVYALDGTGTPDHPYGHPYTVSEQNFTIEVAQPRAGNRHAVFFVHPREALSYHYERRPQDPRVSHAIALDVDRFGHVLKSLAIAYGRREADPGLSPADQAKQTELFITYTQNDFTNAVDEPIERPDDYRAPLPASARTYELTGFAPGGAGGRFNFDQWAKNSFEELTAAIEIPYEDASDSAVKQKRVIEHVRTRYRRNDLTGLLPQGGLESLALPGESYKLALTPGLLTQVFRRATADGLAEALLPDPAAVLGGKTEDQGGYVDLDSNGHWWVPSGLMFYSPDASVSDPASTATAESVEATAHFFQPRKFVDPFGQAVTVEYDTHHLLAVTTVDAVANAVAARHDYRVLLPAEVTDPNGNRSQVIFDAFGLVAGTVVMGKVGEDRGDTADGFDAEPTLAQTDALLDADDPQIVAHSLLGGATARVVYDTGRFQRTRQAHPDTPADWEPVYAVSLARETHVNDLQDGQAARIQIGFSYSDGFGREIQKKVQAEPGPVLTGGPDVSPRWVGTGWTIFNNKGKPVRQYEPFFSQLPAQRHRFEFGVQAGVSPILFYDPVERVVATLHPNHTWEKVVFDAWRQETWDANDTVTLDPAADEVMKGFVLEPDGSPRLPIEEYLPTWHALRTHPDHALAAEQKWPDPGSRSAEKAAAEKAGVHAATPTVTHFDALGRAFLTVAHNRLRRSDTPPADPPNEAFFSTRVTFDIEGNQLDVTDAKGRVVMRYDYDLVGNRLRQASMDAGARWMLLDVSGKPIRTWDDRRFIRRMTYDVLRRPTGLFVSTDGAPESLAEKTEYGEGKPDAGATNHRARAWKVSDGAGILISEAYDFKGNLLHSGRRLLADYKSQVNWALAPALEGEQFSTHTVYDALNRPVQIVAPHSDRPGTLINVLQPLYNESNLLEQVHAWLNQDTEPSELLNPSTATLHAVTDIDYDAKGQRTLIEYGNGARTTYLYEPETFRLSRLLTRRNPTVFPDDCPQPAPAGWPGCQVQNLHYTYDPVGNITHFRDEAQQTIYFRNTRVEPSAEYGYDAIYRLIEATGREHLGQLNGGLQPPIPASHTDIPRVGQLHPGDGKAMGNYTELYDYDAVGNIDRVRHASASGAWTRTYAYSVAPGQDSNRLVNSIVGGLTETFTHDVHGNMTSMPHLSQMSWDFEDQLQSVELGGGGATHFTYDAAGQRVRKVWEKSPGLVEERIYLGAFEVFRRRNGGVIGLEGETLHLMDDKRRVGLVETKTVDLDSPTAESPVSVVRYQLGNHLGSACLELDDEAGLISYEECYPYGSTSYQATHSGAELGAKRYRYTGKERDDETGLYYHGARYYAPWLGEWTSCDSNGIDIAISPYGYVIGNPALYVDPDGHDYSLEGEGEPPIRVQSRPGGGFTVKEAPAHIANRVEENVLNYELTGDEKYLDAALEAGRKAGMSKQQVEYFAKYAGVKVEDRPPTWFDLLVLGYQPGGGGKTGRPVGSKTNNTLRQLGHRASPRSAGKAAPIRGNPRATKAAAGAGGSAKTVTNPGGFNEISPDKSNRNCIASTAAMLKNQTQEKRPDGRPFTVKDVDPHGLVTDQDINRAGHALKAVSRMTGMSYSDKPVDLKTAKLDKVQAGHYVLIARTDAGGHMVYAQKTESGKFIVYDAQNARLYTAEEFRQQYSSVAGYRFYYEKPRAK